MLPGDKMKGIFAALTISLLALAGCKNENSICKSESARHGLAKSVAENSSYSNKSEIINSAILEAPAFEGREGSSVTCISDLTIEANKTKFKGPVKYQVSANEHHSLIKIDEAPIISLSRKIDTKTNESKLIQQRQ